MGQAELARAFDKLLAKQADYAKLEAYARGDQKLVYSTERLREAFANVNARFAQNWLKVVIFATLDRLTMKGWNTQDTGSTEVLNKVWNEQRMNVEAYNAHKCALITSEAFYVVDDTEGEVEIYFNESRNCYIQFDPEHPKKKLWAAKWYKGADNRHHMVLYFPDHFEYYETKGTELPVTYRGFLPSPLPEAPNEMGGIPMFRMECEGELGDLLSLQDAVNKLFADMMVVSEYGAFPQRYIISNADTTTLKNAPNIIWDIPAADAGEQASAAGQFPATDLSNYSDTIDKIANSMAIISRTPKHYFYGEGSNVSGEALLAMEAPLVKKVRQIQEMFDVCYQELGVFVLALYNVVVDQTDIQTVWATATSVQPLTESQATKTNKEAGIPLVTVLRRNGWAEDEIAQMEQDLAEAEKKGRAMSELLLQNLILKSAQSNQTPTDAGIPEAEQAE